MLAHSLRRAAIIARGVLAFIAFVAFVAGVAVSAAQRGAVHGVPDTNELYPTWALMLASLVLCVCALALCAYASSYRKQLIKHCTILVGRSELEVRDDDVQFRREAELARRSGTKGRGHGHSPVKRKKSFFAMNRTNTGHVRTIDHHQSAMSKRDRSDSGSMHGGGGGGGAVSRGGSRRVLARKQSKSGGSMRHTTEQSLSFAAISPNVPRADSDDEVPFGSPRHEHERPSARRTKSRQKLNTKS
jgi:uncharacterized membrane protein YgcG